MFTFYYQALGSEPVKEKSPLSIKLSRELHQRLIRAAEETGIPKHRLAEMAIEAAVAAIERNGYKLVVPIEFEVAEVPMKKSSSQSRFPASKPGQAFELNEGKPPKKKSAA